MIRNILIITVLCFFQAFGHPKFLLLMGPSGVGKSTIIKHLKALDNRFTYVTPLTTRPLRDNEHDKIHASVEEIEKLQSSGKLLTVNFMYGIYYATPKNIIDEALANNNFPVLDWPLDRLDVMINNYGQQLFKVYVEPEDVQELQRRLAIDDRDKDGKRYLHGEKEMAAIASGSLDSCFDLKIVNKNGRAQDSANIIYDAYLKSLKD